MPLYCEEHCGTRNGMSTIPVSCPECIIDTLNDKLCAANDKIREQAAIILRCDTLVHASNGRATAFKIELEKSLATIASLRRSLGEE